MLNILFNSPYIKRIRAASLPLLCVLCLYAVNISAQDWKVVADGVEYAEVRREFSGKAVNINLLRLDLKKVRLDVHHAMDMAIGTEKTSSIATRHRAFAAINAGFFRLDKSEFAGDAAGILMVDGELLSESFLDRATLFLLNGDSKKTHLFFGHYQTRVWLQFGAKPWDSTIELSGVNRERKVSEAILYNGKISTKLMPGDLELRLNKCSFLPFLNSSDAETRCAEVEIVRERVDVKLKNPQFTAVLDSDYIAKNRVNEKVGAFDNPSKKTVVIRTRIKDGNIFPFTAGDVDITNGVPQLIKDGKIDITWEQEKASKSFVETRHPRTAVAKLKDGKFLMLTADGRSEQSAGLDLYDLAKYMLELGGVDAMNLDGGGSTTMFLDGKVVNKPSDKDGERKVGDAILVTLRKKKKN